MDEEMTGLFRCRNCGAVLEEKVNVTQAVNWAIKDMVDPLKGDDITSTISKTLLPDRFIIHWCKKEKAGICDLIGWKVGKKEQDDRK
jgi:hypothetical protein